MVHVNETWLYIICERLRAYKFLEDKVDSVKVQNKNYIPKFMFICALSHTDPDPDIDGKVRK